MAKDQLIVRIVTLISRLIGLVFLGWVILGLCFIFTFIKLN